MQQHLWRGRWLSQSSKYVARMCIFPFLDIHLVHFVYVCLCVLCRVHGVGGNSHHATMLSTRDGRGMQRGCEQRGMNSCKLMVELWPSLAKGTSPTLGTLPIFWEGEVLEGGMAYKRWCLLPFIHQHPLVVGAHQGLCLLYQFSVLHCRFFFVTQDRLHIEFNIRDKARTGHGFPASRVICAVPEDIVLDSYR